MSILTLVGIGEFLGACLTGAAGNYTHAGLTAVYDRLRQRWTDAERRQNHDLERAVTRAFLQAQRSIGEACLQLREVQADGPSHAWLKAQLRRLEDRMDHLKGEGWRPPVDELSDIALLLGPPAPDEATHVRRVTAMLVKAALAGEEPPDAYRQLLEGNLFEQMNRHFAKALKFENEPARKILQLELLADLRRDLDRVDLTVERVEQKLLALADAVPALADQVRQWAERSAREHADIHAKLNVIHEAILNPPDRSEPAPAREPLFAVPYHRNAAFTGREGWLSALRTDWDTLATPIQVLTGMGGLGKTQTALEYAYRHQADYLTVLWVGAEEPAAIAASYHDLARRLMPARAGEWDQQEAVRQVLQWLARSRDWLLILDNAEEPTDELLAYLPHDLAGHVLITSRNPNWERHAGRVVHLGQWSEGEAEAFLAKRTGRREPAATALAEALGYLPLALEQAAAYIADAQMAIAAYLDLFRAEAAVLEEIDGLPDYNHTVATTWKISTDAIGREAEAGEEGAAAALQLMHLAAFLAPERIPLDLLGAGAEALPEPLQRALTEKRPQNRMLKVLRRHSLVERSGDEVTVHRLVQMAERGRLNAEERQEWAETAVSQLNGAFPYKENKVETWQASGRLLLHALAACDHAVALGVGQGAATQLLNEAGRYLRRQGQFGAARVQLERALSLADAIYGEEHASTAAILNNLAGILQDLGDLQGARERLEKALAIYVQTYGEEHPAVATDLNNLALVLQDLGDLQGARERLEKARAIDVKTYGEEHPEVATDLNNLATVLRALGDLQGARERFEKALAIAVQTYGEEHASTAAILNNLALVLQDLGDLEGARERFEKALAIDVKTYGDEHPDVARDLNNLALVLLALGDRQGARKRFEKALTIAVQTYGEEHPAVATMMLNLAVLHVEEGDPTQARPLAQRALAIKTRILGAAHPDTLALQAFLEGLD